MMSPVHTTYGRMLWDLAGQENNLNQFFNEAMASNARLVTSVLLEHCGGDFEGLDGSFAKGIAKAFRKISCTSFDLPHVVDGLVGNKSLSYVGGDMFKAIPEADALLMISLILKQCKEAIPNKETRGKLIIIDMVVKVHEGEKDLLETQLFFDMLMATLATRRERFDEDWAKLFIGAGFSDYKITPFLGLRSLIEVYS
ncbi:putative trans-resveratrol di-O-methyltransferase [Helianthus annuus]|nr:putative trans-resveratrol di-O-methyltransferase [Helianthus annuus]